MRIAISGTIGSGKSTVSNYLRSLGYVVLSCDEINYELQKFGNEGYYKIIESFSNILDDSGEINRQKLASIVFSDENELKKLNDIMHPLIKTKLLEMMSNYSLVFAEVPLLFETDFYTLFDKNVLIVANRDIVLKRLIERGLSLEEAKNRINNQLADEIKISKANEVIYNNGSVEELKSQVDMWLEREVIC